MDSQPTNRTLLITMFVIGAIIIVLLLSQQGGSSLLNYSSRGNVLTASSLSFDTPSQQAIVTSPGHYTITKTYTEPTLIITPSHTYTVPTYQYDYSYQQQYVDPGIMFPDGCTMTSPYSLTTGEPCS